EGLGVREKTSGLGSICSNGYIFGGERHAIQSERPSELVVMPRRQDLRKILLVGAGPIVIGQACEFDYS
ncbi:MAG TPA: hypothetical protein DCQ32_09100, partial [Cyanobacteria bacterium UBA8156]|nr:hypothetical protein [Cyanobacteria bacterium UBA8156]